MQIKCLAGVADAKVANATSTTKPKDFDEWIMRVQGKGIADLFMRPYNFKVLVLATSTSKNIVVLGCCAFPLHNGLESCLVA